MSYRESLWMILFLSFITYAWLATSIGPVLPSISEEFLLSPAKAGFIIGLYSIGGLLSIAGGYISDRFNRVLTSSLFLILYSISSILVAFSMNEWEFGASLTLMGIFAGFLEATVNSLVSEVYTERRGSSMVLFHISWNIGSAIGPPFAAASIIVLGGWRIAYLIPAIFLLCLSMTLSIISKKIKIGITGIKGKECRDPNLGYLPIFISTIAIFYMAAEMGLSNWITSILETLGLRKIEAGLVNGLFWGFMGIGRICWAPLTDRMGYGKTLFVSSSASLLLILTASLQLPPNTKAGLWAFTGFCLAPIFPTIIAWVTSLKPKSGGLLSGLTFTNGAIGAFASTWSAGLIAEFFGIIASQYVFTVFTFMMVANVIFAIDLERSILIKRKQDQKGSRHGIQSFAVGIYPKLSCMKFLSFDIMDELN
ncbi:MAG: MFS transporter [Thermoproteota archaeon]